MTKPSVLAACLLLVACGRTPAVDEAPRVAAIEQHTQPLGLWQADESYVYALDVGASSELAGASGAFTMSLRGELELVGVADPSGTVLHGVLHQPRVTAAGAATVNGDELEKELSRPFRAHLDSGRLTELELAEGTSPQSVALLRTLLAALQAPPQLQSSAVVEEHDATGRYEAAYTTEGSEVSKRKLRYLNLLALGPALGARSVPRVLTTSGVMKATDDGVWERVLLEEQLETELPGGAMVRSRSQVQLRLLRRSAENSLAKDQQRWSGGLRLAAEAPYAAASARAAFDALRIDGMTVQQALARIRNAPSHARAAKPGQRSESVSEEAMNAFSALSTLLRRDATHAGEVLALARKNEQLAPPLLDALASAGTPEAQRVLIGLVAELDEPLRRRAARSLIRVQMPIEEHVALLHSLIDDPQLAAHGIYGLGTAARRLREAGQVARAAAISETLAQLLGRAKDDTRRIRVLRGIANAADTALLDRVRPLLEHTSYGVREAAVHALQQMKAAEVERLLAQRLELDRHAAVRTAAATAIGLQGPSAQLAQALSQAALRDADTHVRHRAIRVMGTWLSKRAELRSTLEQVSRSDREPKLRDQALRALAGHIEPG